LDANRAIHTKYGPVGDPYRDGNPALWCRHARATIIPNNRKILQVLEANRHLLTRDEQETLAVYRLHVEQFEDRHILDDFTTGTERFPKPSRESSLRRKRRTTHERRAGRDREEVARAKFSSTRLPSFQLEIERAPRPDARVLCIGL
jgi:hypothetical protein